MEEIIWKECPGLDYKISNTGLIWSSRRSKFSNPHVSNGYNVILLYQNGRGKTHRVDKLVTQCFDLTEKDILIHLEGNLNDNVSNLRWMPLRRFFRTIRKKGEKWRETEHSGYFVSSTGRVWSRKSESFMSLRYDDYVTVSIPKFAPHVHVLVAKAFIPNPEGYKVVNHKDGNGTNNIVDNLEWLTHKGNADHARYELKRAMGTKGMKRKYSPKPIDGIKIKGMEKYLATPQGKIYSLKSNIYMTETTCGNKYPRVTIGDSKYCVHKLVAYTFLSPPSEKQDQVNHIDGDKFNNCVDNLEWITGGGNMEHCVKLHQETYNRNQKPVIRIDIDSGQEERYKGVKNAARENNVNSGSIVKACKGQRPSAGGYKWKYLS